MIPINLRTLPYLWIMATIIFVVLAVIQQNEIQHLQRKAAAWEMLYRTETALHVEELKTLREAQISPHKETR